MTFEQEFTNYHFDCKPDALYSALQRFSQFFVAPLCKADALEREVNAVDNEFSGMLLSFRSVYWTWSTTWHVAFGNHILASSYSASLLICPPGVQQDDSMRLAQLRCHTSCAGHIYRKFTWGNKKSLVSLPAEKGIDVRSELVQYYK